jgi:hypothetical protein
MLGVGPMPGLTEDCWSQAIGCSKDGQNIPAGRELKTPRAAPVTPKTVPTGRFLFD